MLWKNVSISRPLFVKIIYSLPGCVYLALRGSDVCLHETLECKFSWLDGVREVVCLLLHLSEDFFSKQHSAVSTVDTACLQQRCVGNNIGMDSFVLQE